MNRDRKRSLFSPRYRNDQLTLFNIRRCLDPKMFIISLFSVLIHLIQIRQRQCCVQQQKLIGPSDGKKMTQSEKEIRREIERNNEVNRLIENNYFFSFIRSLVRSFDRRRKRKTTSFWTQKQAQIEMDNIYR